MAHNSHYSPSPPLSPRSRSPSPAFSISSDKQNDGGWAGGSHANVSASRGVSPSYSDDDDEDEGEDRVGEPGEREKMRELEVGADVVGVIYRVDSVSDVGHGRESRPATKREDLRRSSTGAEKKRGKSRRRRRHA